MRKYYLHHSFLIFIFFASFASAEVTRTDISGSSATSQCERNKKLMTSINKTIDSKCLCDDRCLSFEGAVACVPMIPESCYPDSSGLVTKAETFQVNSIIQYLYHNTKNNNGNFKISLDVYIDDLYRLTRKKEPGLAALLNKNGISNTVKEYEMKCKTSETCSVIHNKNKNMYLEAITTWVNQNKKTNNFDKQIYCSEKKLKFGSMCFF